jgi:hypothetical protein
MTSRQHPTGTNRQPYNPGQPPNSNNFQKQSQAPYQTKGPQGGGNFRGQGRGQSGRGFSRPPVNPQSGRNNNQGYRPPSNDQYLTDPYQDNYQYCPDSYYADDSNQGNYSPRYHDDAQQGTDEPFVPQHDDQSNQLINQWNDMHMNDEAYPPAEYYDSNQDAGYMYDAYDGYDEEYEESY